MWRPWTGPPAGRQGHKTGQQRQGLGARSPRSPRCCWKPHADGHRHAAGHSESQPGGARKPCSCPAMILEETGVGVRLRSGEQAGKLGTRTAPPQGPPAVTRVVCRRVSSLQVWISPEHPMLCCVVMLSEDARVPSSPSSFSFFPSFLWLPWFGKVPG